MIGRGVIATTYGWALEQAGHHVEFLVRSGRAAEYGPTVELDLLDARHRRLGERITGSWSLRFREQLESDHDFDLIILSVGHHRLATAVEFLAPRIADATVLMFGSVWAEPAEALTPLPAEQLAWGFPQAGGGFNARGALQAALLRKVIFGTLETEPTAREKAVRDLFASAGFDIAEQPDFRGWLWMHFIADAGMHSQGVQLGSLSDMIGHPASFREALLTSRELLPVVEARGVDLRRHRGSALQFRIPVILTAPMMSAVTAHVALARASLEAHTDPHAEEPRSIVRDVLQEARRLGVPTPRLDVAGASIEP
jgi:2-dehydropantoate 2-reductase